MAQKEIIIRGIYVDDVSPNLIKSGNTIRVQTTKSKKDIELLGTSFDVLKKSSEKLGEEIKGNFDVGTEAIKRFTTGSRGIFNDIGTFIGRIIKSFAMMAVSTLALKMAIGGLLMIFSKIEPNSHPFLKFIQDSTWKLFLFAEKLLISNKLTESWGLKLAEMTRKPLFENLMGKDKVTAWERYWAKVKSILTGTKEKLQSTADGAGHLGETVNKTNKILDSLSGFIGKASAPLKAFDGAVSFVSKSFVAIAVSIGTFLVAIAAVKKIFELVGEFTKLGTEIYRNSLRMGLSTQAYQKWDFALKETGSSVDELIPAISKLQKTAVGAEKGTDNASLAFRALGLSAKDTSGAFKSGQQLFEETISKLAAMTDITKRNTLAQDIFGESASKLIPILSKNSEELKNIVGTGSKYAAMTDKAIAGSVMLSKASSEVGLSFSKIGSSLVEGLIPRIASVLQGVQESGFLVFLEQLAVAGGKVISFLFMPLQKALESLSVGFAAIRMDINGFVFAIAKSLSVVANVLPKLIMPDAAKRTLKAFADSFGEDLNKSVSDYEKTVARFKRINPAIDKISTPVSTPDKVEKESTTKAVKEAAKRESAVNKEIEKMNVDRLAIIDKYAEISINHMENEYAKRRALVLFNDDKERYELEKSILFGQVREEDAANFRIALANKKSDELIAIDREEKKELQNSEDKLQKALADIKYSHIAITQGKKEADIAKDRDELEKWHNDQIALLANNKNALLLVEEAYSQKLLDLDSRTMAARAEKVGEYVGAAQEVLGSLSSMQSEMHKSQEMDIDRETEQKKEAAKSQYRNKKELDKALENIDKEAEKKRRQLAKTEMAMNIAQAIANTAQGVTKAIAQGGVLGIITGALVAAAGAVSVGFMIAQYSKMAKGGVVGGVGNTDTEPTMLTPGEVVLNRQQQANTLMAIANGQGSSKSMTITGGPTQVIIQGNADEAVVNRALKVNRQKQMENMRQLLKDMQYSGSLRMQVA